MFMISRLVSLSGLCGLLILGGCVESHGHIVSQNWVDRPGRPTMHFLNTPSEADVLAVYPRPAFDAGVEGSAYVQCRFTETGGFDQCVVLEETPAGHAFGDGALRVMTYYRWDPAAYPEMIGKPARQRVWFRMR